MKGIVGPQAVPACLSVPTRPLWARTWPLMMVVAFALLYFAPALLQGRVIAPLDIWMYYLPWSAHPPAGYTGVHNASLTDGAFYLLPVRHLVWEEWRSGTVPLWNPYALGGTPLLGHDIGAALYPVTLIGTFMPFVAFWNVLLVSSLVIAGTGTFLYLRAIGLDARAAICGPIVYMTSSFMIIWLTQSTSTVGAYFPWLLWGVECYLRRRGSGALLALSLVVFLQFLAGDVEESTLTLTLAALYILWRLAPDLTQRRQVALVDAGLLVGAGLVGTALAAFQILPTLVTILGSASLHARTHGAAFERTVLPLQSLFTWFVPDAFGNTATGSHAFYGPANFTENTGYAGVTALVLAGLACARRGDRPRSVRAPVRAVIFTTVLALGLVYAIPGVHLLTFVPPLRFVADVRAIFGVCFGIAVFSSLSIGDLLAAARLPSRCPGPAALVAFCGPVVGAGIAYAANLSLHAAPQLALLADVLHRAGILVASPQAGALYPAIERAAILAAFTWSLWWTGAGVRGRAAIAMAATLVALVSVDLVGWGHSYNTTVPAAWASDEPAVLRTLSQSGATITASPDLLIPNTAAYFDVRDIRAYEPTASMLMVQYLGQGLGHVDPRGSSLPPPNLNRLSVAGVKYVLTDGPIPGAIERGVPVGNNNGPGPLYGRRDLQQSFVAARDNLQAVRLFFATIGRRSNHATLTVSVLDAHSRTPLASVTRPISALPNNSLVTFSFSRIRRSGRRPLILKVAAPNAAASYAPTVGTVDNFSLPGGSLRIEGRASTGTLYFQAFYATPQSARYRRLYARDGITVWRDTDARPVLYLARGTRTVQHGRDAIPLVDGLPPGGRAVVAPLSLASSGKGSVVILSHTYSTLDANITVSHPSFAVFNVPRENGWRASIDGRDVHLYAANDAFQGIVVPAGRHRVHFEYRPMSFTLGLLITGAALLLLGLGFSLRRALGCLIEGVA